MMIRRVLATAVIVLASAAQAAPPEDGKPKPASPAPAAPTVAPPTTTAPPAPPTAEQIGAGAQRTLAHIPEDAVVVITLRNIHGINDKLVALLRQLFIPFDPYRYVKGQLELVAGIDDYGTAAIVLLKPETPDASAKPTGPRMVLMIPTTDTDMLLATVAPERVSDTLKRVRVGGKETYAGTKGHLTIFGADESVVRSVVGAKGSLLPKLADYHAQRVLENDLAIWIDTKALAQQASADPMFEMMLMGMGLHKASIERFESLSWAVDIKPEGVRMTFVADEGAGAGGKRTTNEQSLLGGLPTESFVAAGGGRWSEATGAFDGLLSVVTMALKHAFKPDQLAQLRDKIRTMSKGCVQASWCISSLPAGEQGIVSMTKIVTTRGDARKLLTETRQLIEWLKSCDIMDARLKKGVEWLTYHEAAETLDGVAVDHLLLATAESDVFDGAALMKVLGQEGLLVRLAVVEKGRIVVTLGGGAARFRAALAEAKADRPTVSVHAAIAESGKHVSDRRFAEAYLAVDGLVKLARAINEATGGVKRIPFMPPIEAPIAVTASQLTDRLVCVDVYVPNKVISALVNWGMQLALTGQAMP